MDGPGSWTHAAIHARRYLLTLLNCVTVGCWCKWSLTEIFELKCLPAASGNWKFIGAVRANHNSFRQSNKENNGPNYNRISAQKRQKMQIHDPCGHNNNTVGSFDSGRNVS